MEEFNHAVMDRAATKKLGKTIKRKERDLMQCLVRQKHVGASLQLVRYPLNLCSEHPASPLPVPQPLPLRWDAAAGWL